MTKREFDRETKLNYGAHYHSATQYKREVRLKQGPRVRDYIAERAWEMGHRNHGNPRDGFLPTLAIGSRFRAPQAWRARNGMPLLERP